jgi:hypothetical protein
MPLDERKLRPALTALFTDAAGPNKRCSRDEIIAAGIPRTFVDSIQRASKTLESPAGIADLVDEYSHLIAKNAATRSYSTNPAELARDVPRVY